MVNIDKMSEIQLEELIEVKRANLNKSFAQQGLNDFTLRKSQELDLLIFKAQKYKMGELDKKTMIIA